MIGTAAREGPGHLEGQGGSLDFILSVMGSLQRALSIEVTIWFPFLETPSCCMWEKAWRVGEVAGMEARRPMSSSWKSR